MELKNSRSVERVFVCTSCLREIYNKKDIVVKDYGNEGKNIFCVRCGTLQSKDESWHSFFYRFLNCPVNMEKWNERLEKVEKDVDVEDECNKLKLRLKRLEYGQEKFEQTINEKLKKKN
ncbi:hypothetical protein SNEBB_005131 [Seison nebaliae]|nr:hypothetical protein SNEBB_005131 [Seison nebaliae]